MASRVETRKLGLAAYLKMKGVPFIGLENRKFVFDSERTEEDWEIEYLNSCCHRHDSELINLRKLIKR